MTDETDTTSEVARVLGEHYPDQTSYDAGDLHGCHCGWEVPRPRSSDTGDWEAYWAHQAAVLAEAGLLREEKPARDPECPCAACDPGIQLSGDNPIWFPSRMNVCPNCGNKRCPKAANHARWECSGSNETGQVGVPAADPQIATQEPAERTQATSGGSGEAESANGSYTPAQHYADGVIHLDEPVSWEIGKDAP